MNTKSTSTLLAGVLLIAVGGLFLAVNLTNWSVSWLIVLKLVLPILFVIGGVVKLYRHYSWKEEQLTQQPGKASLLGGLFWLSFGVVLLLDIMGALETLAFIGLFWPILLIVYGIGKVIDFYRLSGRLQLRSGELFGVVFVIAFGIACGQLAKAHTALLDHVTWGDSIPIGIGLDSQEQRFEVEESVPLEGIEEFEIENIYGDIAVTPGDPGQAEVRLVKVVLEEERAAAEAIASEVTIRTEREEARLKITPTRAQVGERGRKLKTHLTVSIPPEIRLVVNSAYGDIKVNDRAADSKISNSYGRIEVDSIIGNVVLSNRYEAVVVSGVEGSLEINSRRGKVEARNIVGNTQITTDHELIECKGIDGDLDVRNQFGRLQLERITGSLKLDGSGSGVTVAHVDGPVEIRNSHKDVSIEKLGNRLNLETSYSKVKILEVEGYVELQAVHSEVDAKDLKAGMKLQGRGSQVALTDVSGELVIETTARRVSVEGFTGPVSVQNQDGQVELLAKERLIHPVRVTNMNGEISLLLPADSSFNLSAQSVEGEIVSDFGPAEEDSRGDVAYLKTDVGKGGPEIELQTTYSRIRIRKRG
ncbi:MAG: hypothetical protein JSU96_09870 [Acidobacteriota bacterium]|nr:MAG: hypothetical protein JSU96_09870 [Acidobacteriota bacterium]